MLKQLSLALLLAVGLAACAPKPAGDKKAADAAKDTPVVENGVEQPKANDPADPFTKLRPWKSANADVKKTANGVEYIILKHGDASGVHPKPTDVVEVQYDGRLAATGKRFDFTPGDETASFGLNQVIPGWTEGLQVLVPGDQAMFHIPAVMGYGERGGGDRIPPNSDLMFLVTLKGILQPKLADEAAWKKALPWPKTAKKTASGLEYIVVSSGPTTEPTATDSDAVLMYYSGRLADGKEFDSSYGSPKPTIMGVGDLIPGWKEALKLMRPGDHWIIKLPAKLAFGDEARGPIPAKSTIYIECEIEKVVRIPTAPPADPAAPPAQPAQPQ